MPPAVASRFERISRTILPMTSVCFYFQVHQPFRIRRYSVFDNDPFYFDNEDNQSICEKVANKCYRPATGRSSIWCAASTASSGSRTRSPRWRSSRFELWAPDVIELFQELAETGACEFIAETSHHSLSFLFSRQEFDEQVGIHQEHLSAPLRRRRPSSATPS